MNVISEIQRINDLELTKGITHTSASWHTKYKDSAWINVGNLPLNLTEGDVICIFSQYGEIDDVNLVRDKDSGKSRGFAFVKYEDARSCVLAVDNLCGSVVLGRSLRVDHVEKYRLPKHVQEREDERIKNGERDDNDDDDESDGSERKKKGVSVAEAGHAYKGQELASSYNIHAGQDLFAAPPKMGSDDQRDLSDGKDSNNDGGKASTIQHKDMDKAERRRRKEERAQKRREKEEHRRKKEERRRRKHDNQHDRRRKEDKRRRSRSDSN